MDTIRVIDRDFQFIGTIENYETYRAKLKLYEKGSVEITTALTRAAARCLQPGNIVYMDSEYPFLLTKYEEDEAKEKITAQGIQLKDIVAYRMTVPNTDDETNLFGYDRFPEPSEPTVPMETVIKHYVEKHLANPEDANRRIPRLVIAEDKGRGDNYRWSSRFESIDKVLKDLWEVSGMGYNISLDLKNKQFVFDVIPPTEQTEGSDSPVIFSAKWGNVSSTKYTIDTTTEQNVAYAGGAGEGESRLIQAVYTGDTPTGFDRKESWLDCGSVELIDDLRFEAEYKMKDKTVTETLTGSVTPTGPFHFGEHYTLGSLVTVQNGRGITRNVQVTEVEMAVSSKLKEAKPVFGKRQSNLLDEIRRTEAIR